MKTTNLNINLTLNVLCLRREPGFALFGANDNVIG